MLSAIVKRKNAEIACASIVSFLLLLPATCLAQSTVRQVFREYVDGKPAAANLNDLDPVQMLRELPKVTDDWLHEVAPGLQSKTRTERDQSPILQQAHRKIASFAVEAAHASLRSGGRAAHPPDRRGVKADKTYMEDLLDFGRAQIADLPVDDFARTWYLSAVAVLEGAQLSGAVDEYATLGLRLFPIEGRFLLAKGVAAEIRTSPYNGVSDSARSDFETARTRFAEARSSKTTGVEAAVRLGFTEFRMGSARSAIEILSSAVEGASDPVITYLAYLFRGRAWMAAGEREQAASDFRFALRTWPRAQSATLALAILKVEEGDRVTAAAWIKEPLLTPGTDPWWIYWIGDARLWNEYVLQLRQFSQ